MEKVRVSGEGVARAAELNANGRRARVVEEHHLLATAHLKDDLDLVGVLRRNTEVLRPILEGAVEQSVPEPLSITGLGGDRF